MKIYGDYTFILDKLNISDHSQVQIFQNGTKIVEFADQFLEEQRAASKDQVSISEEGIDYLREKLSGLRPDQAEDPAADGGRFRNDSDYGLSLMDGVCRGYILGRLDFNGINGVSHKLYGELQRRYQEGLSGRQEKNVTAHAESLVNAYAAMYQRIADGYAEGSREVWTEDPSMGEDFNGVEFEMNGQPVRYRKLTMEEELGRLKDSFDRLVEDISRQLAWEEAGKAAKAGEAADEPEDVDFWKMADITKAFLEELDGLIRKLEEMFARKEPEPEKISERLASEVHSHGAATVIRGMQQAQLSNYRKISQMASDVRTVLGSIRA